MGTIVAFIMIGIIAYYSGYKYGCLKRDNEIIINGDMEVVGPEEADFTIPCEDGVIDIINGEWRYIER